MATVIRTVTLCSGRYVGKRRAGKRHTHAAVISHGKPLRLLCGNASVASVCFEVPWTNEPPTCGRCKSRLAVIRKGEQK